MMVPLPVTFDGALKTLNEVATEFNNIDNLKFQPFRERLKDINTQLLELQKAPKKDRDVKLKDIEKEINKFCDEVKNLDSDLKKIDKLKNEIIVKIGEIEPNVTNLTDGLKKASKTFAKFKEENEAYKKSLNKGSWCSWTVKVLLAGAFLGIAASLYAQHQLSSDTMKSL